VRKLAYGQTILAAILGAVLFAGGLAGGFLIQNYLETRSSPNLPSSTTESLSIENHTMKLFTKLAIQLNLKNNGTTDIYLTDVQVNGQSNESTAGMTQGWNGTAILHPNQTSPLYVYLPCYTDALNMSVPDLSTSPTATELENLESWLWTYNCTMTIFTNTARQYTYTITDFGWAFIFLQTLTQSQTFTFTNTEQILITNMAFGPAGSSSWVAVTVNNTGTSAVTINEAWINNVKQTNFNAGQSLGTIPANSGAVINMTTVSVANGYNYQVKLMSSKGNLFLYAAVAPTS
jgi:hypothetical protein